MGIKNLLRQKCNILRSTDTITGPGHTHKEWATIASDVKCFISGLTGSGNITQTTSGHVITNAKLAFFLPNQDIKAGDKVLYDGNYYYVEPPDPVMAGLKGTVHHVEAILVLEGT